MSDEEFLKRWSRRKQQARETEDEPSGRTLPPPANAADGPPDAVATASEPEIDLSKLPPIDSITAATDITEFLRKGVPAELGRAALRRAWAADPAIRDFVGLAENAWDFTDPNAMPGFGALHATPEQIGAMVERAIGGVRETVEKLVSDLPGNEQVQSKPDPKSGVLASAEDAQAEAGTALPNDSQAEPVAAAQPERSDEDGDVVPIRRRRHGGALPG